MRKHDDVPPRWSWIITFSWIVVVWIIALTLRCLNE